MPRFRSRLSRLFRPVFSKTALLAMFAFGGAVAHAQPSMGDGVVIECPVTNTIFGPTRALMTCADGFSDVSGLHNDVEFPYGSSPDHLWLAERAVDLMVSAPRDSADRPIIGFNIMYQGSGRPGRVMDVRAQWSSESSNSITGRIPSNARPRLTRPGLQPNSTGTTPASNQAPQPDNGDGVQIACHVSEIKLLSDRSRFTCADGFNSSWSGLHDEIDLRYDMSANNQWMLERAIDLLASAPRDSASRPILHFNIMYRGPGTPAYAMDVRTQY